jgi:hypothetical protein
MTLHEHLRAKYPAARGRDMLAAALRAEVPGYDRLVEADVLANALDRVADPHQLRPLARAIVAAHQRSWPREARHAALAAVTLCDALADAPDGAPYLRRGVDAVRWALAQCRWWLKEHYAAGFDPPNGPPGGGGD